MDTYATFDLLQPDGHVSTVHCWTPTQARAKAVVQLAHGMGEYAKRYDQVAKDLGNSGYIVYANDHRGHGEAARISETLGDFGGPGFPALAEDMAALSTHIKRMHPQEPLFLLGHSMGSFAAQLYALNHCKDISGLVLSGSSALDILAADFAKVELVDGEFPNVLNAAFEPARTAFDWLSRDQAQVDAYIASPLCGFSAAPESFVSMLGAGQRTGDLQALRNIRSDLPIYIFSGDHDPVGGNGALLDVLAQRYRDAGIQDVSLRKYADGRHEMFNETNREEVIAELVSWLDGHLLDRSGRT